MNIRKVVDGNNSDQHHRQLDQTALLALLLCELSFSSGKIARAVRDCFDAFDVTDREVSHLNVGFVIAVFLRPPVVNTSYGWRHGV
jgi:hypothetical protein